MKKNYQNKILNSGRSMIEMLGVIAIGGILTAGTIQLYGYATRKTKSLQMENQIADTSEDVKTLLLGRSWEKLDRIADEATARQYLEKKKIKMMDAWGNPIVIMRTADKSLGRFVIILDKISMGDCINLGKRVSASTIKVGGVEVKPPAVPLCDKDENKIEFFYK